MHNLASQASDLLFLTRPLAELPDLPRDSRASNQNADWLIDWIEFYAVSAIFQSCYGVNALSKQHENDITEGSQLLYRRSSKKWGSTTIESGPQYIYFFEKFCIFWRKLHDIFCIVCSFMLHSLHRTYIPHLWYIKQNSWWGSLINLHSFKSTTVFTALELYEHKGVHFSLSFLLQPVLWHLLI